MQIVFHTDRDNLKRPGYTVSKENLLYSKLDIHLHVCLHALVCSSVNTTSANVQTQLYSIIMTEAKCL